MNLLSIFERTLKLKSGPKWSARIEKFYFKGNVVENNYVNSCEFIYS